MITDGRNHLNIVRRRLWYLVGAVVYSTALVALYERGHDWIDAPVSIPAMLGTALSILLGFRTASSYDRWWEARKVWGAIVNDSRTFTRQVLTLVLREDGSRPEALHKELVYRQIAWTHVLARSLRRQDPLTDIDSLLSVEEIDALRDQQNIPNALLQTQGEELGEAYRRGLVDKWFLVAITDTLKRLTDHMGMCERIKSTVFPGHYSFFISRTLLVFYLLLPSGLVQHLGWLTIPVALIIELLFATIESAGIILQDPFENRPTDTPMTALSRTIEINLRQQLGETELPEKLQPVDGVLM
jgi:putative membrane protein